MPHVPRADREQGVPQPEHRVDASPRHGRAEPDELCSGVLVVDDFTPSRTWPPSYAGRTDTARLHWLEHPALRTVDLPLAADLSAVVAVQRTDL
ncbi:hypothetical protein [Streptomyces sp. NPDC001135]